MFIAGVVIVVLLLSSLLASRWPRQSHRSTKHVVVRQRSAALLVGIVAISTPMVVATNAGAAIVPTVQLATAAKYAVLAGSEVTNTGPSVLDNSLGLWPGPAISGFPPGLVLPPGTTDENNAVAQQAQSDLTAAYGDAAGRPIDATTAADLANLTLQGGVYAGPDHAALQLTGPLTLDGANNPNTVFIFQTNSTLTTASASTVNLINGAQECNVFWQVGSSATLGTGSSFTGNILALTSITVTTGVTVHGRALARNRAVTLDTDVFTTPTCAAELPTTTTTTLPGTTTSTAAETTTSTLPETTTSTAAQATTTVMLPATTTSSALVLPPTTLLAATTTSGPGSATGSSQPGATTSTTSNRTTSSQPGGSTSTQSTTALIVQTVPRFTG